MCLVGCKFKVIFTVILVIFKLNTAAFQKYCTLTLTSVFCDGFAPFENFNRSHEIFPDEIKSIDFSDTVLENINSIQLSLYHNVEVLNLAQCRLKTLDCGIFANLTKLTKVNLSGNFLSKFDSRVFGNVSNVEVLILSNNLLINFDDFNVTQFQNLTVLDLKNNRLKYLPKSLIRRMVDNSDFSLFGQTNPWICDHPKWRKEITSDVNLMLYFCAKNGTVINQNLVPERKKVKNCYACEFMDCWSWTLGAFWVGIIVGNLNLLKKLLFNSPICAKKIKYEDKCVGTELDIYFLQQYYLPRPLQNTSHKYSK